MKYKPNWIQLFENVKTRVFTSPKEERSFIFQERKFSWNSVPLLSLPLLSSFMLHLAEMPNADLDFKALKCVGNIMLKNLIYNFEDFFHQSAFVFPISRTKKSNFLHQFWNSFWNLSEICFFPLSCRIALVVLSSAPLDRYCNCKHKFIAVKATFTFVWHTSTQVTFTFALKYRGRQIFEKSVTPFLSSVLLR